MSFKLKEIKGSNSYEIVTSKGEATKYSLKPSTEWYKPGWVYEVYFEDEVMAWIKYCRHREQHITTVYETECWPADFEVLLTVINWLDENGVRE